MALCVGKNKAFHFQFFAIFVNRMQGIKNKARLYLALVYILHWPVG